jgi:uncharacterized protein involved in cysteine biosynthesis
MRQVVKPQIKVSTIICVLLNAIVWGGLVFMGYGGLQSVAQRHVPGYPSAGQFDYYVYAPLVVLIISIVWPLCFWRFSALVRNFVPVLTLMFLPIYLFPYTGGI